MQRPCSRNSGRGCGPRGLGDEPASIKIQRLRQLHLSFYRGCAQAVIQLQRPGQATSVLASAQVPPGGAVLLDGKADIVHAINPDLLALDGDATTIAYLRFFCSVVRGEEGPFQIIDDIQSVPMDDRSRGAAGSARGGGVSSRTVACKKPRTDPLARRSQPWDRWDGPWSQCRQASPVRQGARFRETAPGGRHRRLRRVRGADRLPRETNRRAFRAG